MIKTLAERIDDDVKTVLTPDLASLRFEQKFVRVFLWGDVEDVRHLLTKGRRLSGDAVTVAKFLPWYSISGTTQYNYYCLEEYEDAPFIVGLEDFALADPLPLKGELWIMPLDTLVELDKFFWNNYDYERMEIDIVDRQDQIIFTWLNCLEDVADYSCDPTSLGEYTLKQGFDLVPFPENKDAQGVPSTYSYK